MKVLNIINSLRAGGAEKLLVDALKIYKEKQIEVDLLLLDGIETDFYQRVKNIEGIKIFTLGSKNNIYSLSHIAKIRKIIRSYDIVHAHLFPTFYFLALAKLSTKSKCKLVYTEHNTTNRRRKSKILKVIDHYIYKQYDVIVSISDAVHESLSHYLGPKISRNLRKVYNGINLEEIKIAEPYTKEELGFNSSDKLLLQVSSFSKQKDQITVIRALKHLKNNVHLILVGEGDTREEHERFAKDEGLANRVHFLGYRNDIPNLLKTVDLVILSSHFEGLSLASIEGMASTKPFIASDVPGLGDVVKNAGILFKECDDRKLAEKVNFLLQDSDKYRSIANQCLERSKLYDIRKMVSSYMDLYKSL